MPCELACPSCHVALTYLGADQQRCPSCGVLYRREQGIWRFLREGREEALRPFVERYEQVRRDEGRCIGDPDHLRALPFRDHSRKRRYEWFIRSRSFEALIRHVVRPLERMRAGPLRILDLGSGLGWLAHRLALRGHAVTAVDLLTNDFDGLGVHRHYGGAFVSVQAEFDHLPIPDRSVDLAVYNASLHYAADYATTLREGLRVLGAEGCVVIMDSPIYRDASSGTAMVRERESALQERHPSCANVPETESFLTYDRIAALGRELGLRWELFQPWYGLRWWSRPWVARLGGGREPAQFALVVGRRGGPS
jgi:SAM-dependent methyltransferase